jgi:hypothetical protein
LEAYKDGLGKIREIGGKEGSSGIAEKYGEY